MSHCGYTGGWRLNEVGAINQSKDTQREGMKGQRGEPGGKKKSLNGTQWERIGRKIKEERFCGDEGRFEKREEDMNGDDLKDQDGKIVR